MEQKVAVGIIGCGNIFDQYMRGCSRFRILNVVACADVDTERAAQVAAKYDLRAATVAELLADPQIEIIINLTIPAAHAEISRAILTAGKHVYSEKPLAISREDGKSILDLAEKCGLLVGCAPDTVLGGGIQTCRQLIDQGQIGEPVAATANMFSHGPESWHPNPIFFYQRGAGPMFDMGPYYLSTLITLLGPVQRVAGATRISFPERIATSAARMGERIPVETPTHVTGLLNFAAGPIATITTSFDIWASNVPRIEIYGSEGTLSVPDPNTFGGPVAIKRAKGEAWEPVPLTHSDEVGRGIGVADLAYAISYGRPQRASGKLAYHVLDIMHAFEESSDSGRHIELSSSCDKPAVLPVGLPDGELDSSLDS